MIRTEAENLNDILYPLSNLKLLRRDHETMNELRDRYALQDDFRAKQDSLAGAELYSSEPKRCP